MTPDEVLDATADRLLMEGRSHVGAYDAEGHGCLVVTMCDVEAMRASARRVTPSEHPPTWFGSPFGPFDRPVTKWISYLRTGPPAAKVLLRYLMDHPEATGWNLNTTVAFLLPNWNDLTEDDELIIDTLRLAAKDYRETTS